MATENHMPPPEFFEEMAKDCRCCPECGHDVPCATACAGGVCFGFCTCAEDEDRQREEDEFDYQEDDAR